MKLTGFVTVLMLIMFSCKGKLDRVKEFLGKHDAAIEDAYMKHRVSDEVKAKGREYQAVFVDSMKKEQIKKRMRLIAMVPDTMPQKIHAWVLKNNTDKMAPFYLRLAIDKMESLQADFLVAKWYEDYVNHFPQGDYKNEALFSAASKYELLGNTSKQLELLKRAIKECPDCGWAGSVKTTIELIEKGKTDPASQFEEIQKQHQKAAE